MKHWFFVVFFFLWSLGQASLQAAEPLALHRPLARVLSSENGLKQNMARALAEDQWGRLWIGTLEGLHLVEGDTVKLVQLPGGQTAGKIIQDLLIDQQFGIWIATNTGLYKADSRTLTVEAITAASALQQIHKLAWLNATLLGILTKDQQLYLLDTQSQQLRQATLNFPVHELQPMADGLLLRNQNQYFLYPSTQHPQQLPLAATIPTHIRSSLWFAERLWLVTSDWQLWNCTAQSCEQVQLPALTESFSEVTALTSWQQQLVIVRQDSIVLYQPENGQSRLVLPQLKSSTYSSRTKQIQLQMLRTGELAIGRDRGVLLVPLSYQNLSSFAVQAPAFSTTLNTLTSVGTNQLLVATDQALELYRTDLPQPALVQQLPYPKPMVPLLFKRLGPLLLMTTAAAGIQLVDLDKAEIAPWPYQFAELEDNQILIDVLPLDQHHFLLLFNRKLMLMRQQGTGFDKVWITDLPTKDTSGLLYQQGQLLVAAYYQGLLSSSHWTDWSQPPLHWQSQLAGDPVLGLRRTGSGELQLWSAEQGVRLLNQNSDGWHATPIEAMRQLPNQTVVCSAELTDGYWFAATHQGIAVFDRSNQLIRLLSEYDGLVQHEFNQFQCGPLGNQVYMAGDSGVTLLGPPQQLSTVQARLDWSHVLVDGVQHLIPDSPLQLTEPNVIEFSFNLGPAPVLAPVRYQYRLEPANPQWFDLNISTLRFSQLATGQYQLNVRAIGADGRWSDPLQLHFSVKPKFWRSPAAYGLYLLLATLLFWLHFRQRWQIQQARLATAEAQHKLQQDYTHQLELAVRQRTASLEQQQQELVLLQQEKIAFLSSTSHDLKNLSALVRLNLTDLRQHLQPSGEPGWHTVNNSCKLLNTLVDDILELSRLNAGVITPQLQLVNLSQLLQQVYQTFVPMAAELKVRLELKVEPDLLVVTDKHLVARMLMNLLDNALKNLQEGELVQLELKHRYPHSQQLYLSIRDSGPGLPQPMRRHWGNAFQRGNQSYQGSGLGLSIVRKIAELLVLPINLYSSERGTSFGLRFVRAEPYTLPAAAVGSALVIDPDPQVRQSLYYELVRHGLQVSVFSSLRDFQRSGQTGFRLLISDIHLNATDDHLTELTLLTSRLAPGGKLLLMSADATLRQRLPEHKAVYFMLKPVKRARLAWLLAKDQ
ncbi:ATP-binding protein [Rheinheimera sp.]|uniref:hybrid sensor histidine kinase/response regulator n=1 Tax=Rheinheimera sp. TaxID=1869214 RepID=UPI00307E1C14